MTCSHTPSSAWTTTSMLCNDRNNIALWNHSQHQQRELSSDLDVTDEMDTFWTACSPRVRRSCSSFSPSRFDNLSLDVDKKIFRSRTTSTSCTSTSSSTRGTTKAATGGRLCFHQAQPPHFINVVVSPFTPKPDEDHHYVGNGNSSDGKIPEVTRQMLEYLWTDEDKEDQSSFGWPKSPSNIVSDQRFNSMVDALCGPSD